VFQVSLKLCIADLEAYKNEVVLHRTYVEEYYNDVVVNEEDGYYYYKKEHRLQKTNTNLKALRSLFVNKLIENIRSR
jgi:hypothetical protein